MKSFERQYRILVILNEKRDVTIGYLAKELNISRKTAVRDIWILCGYLPIRTMPGRYGGGVSYIDNYRYCNCKFYLSEEQESLINKVIEEGMATGSCCLMSYEMEILIDIVNKYSKSLVENKKLGIKIC